MTFDPIGRPFIDFSRDSGVETTLMGVPTTINIGVSKQKRLEQKNQVYLGVWWQEKMCKCIKH